MRYSGFSGLGVLLLTLSQAYGWFYTFDADHYYHRGTWSLQLIAIVGMAIDLTILFAIPETVRPGSVFMPFFFLFCLCRQLRP